MHPRKKSISFFIFTSVLLHLVLMLLWLLLGDKTFFPTAPDEQKPLWVDLKKEELPLVDIPPPAIQEKPDQASAESLYDRKATEETVASGLNTPSHPQGQMPVPPAPKIPVQKKPTPKSVGAIHELPLPESPPNPPPKPPQEYIPGMPELAEKQETGGDYLPDFKRGNRTYLNTQANPNVAYFVELRTKFKITWDPVSVLRGRVNELNQGKIEVILGLTVNADGTLSDVVVLKTSGLPSYDQEGIRTVRSSSPYSRPPANRLDANGQMNMAWYFIVYL